MMIRLPRLSLCLAAACASVVLVGAAAQARPVTPAEKRYEPFDAQIPRCDDPSVLARIQSAFAQKEAGYWGSTIELVAFEGARQTAWRPWGLDHTPRRFCQARAVTNEPAPPHRPRVRRVSYSVVEDAGFAGYGFGVEWCVAGLDRNLAYAPGCKAARP